MSCFRKHNHSKFYYETFRNNKMFDLNCITFLTATVRDKTIPKSQYCPMIDISIDSPGSIPWPVITQPCLLTCHYQEATAL